MGHRGFESYRLCFWIFIDRTLDSNLREIDQLLLIDLSI